MGSNGQTRVWGAPDRLECGADFNKSLFLKFVCVCVWGGVQKIKGRHQEVRVRVELRFPVPSREARSLHHELSRVVLFVCFVFLGFGVQRVLGFFEFRA